MPRTQRDLLTMMSASGMVLQTNSEKNTSAFQTSPTSEPFDYWSWYNDPGNSIRAFDEAHGITLNRNDKGELRFSADLSLLNPDAQPKNLYPTYFTTRTFDRFSISVYSFANHELATKALHYAKRYVAKIDDIMASMRGIGLYFTSKTKGSGKTFLSTIVGNELTRAGKRVLWYSMPNLLQEIKNSYDRDSGVSTADVIDRIKRVPVLMLDDIGVERQSSWVNETVFSILDYRLLLGKPTIFTSNHLPDELSYDERIIDRIRSMASIIRLPEENVRKRLSASFDIDKFLGE